MGLGTRVGAAVYLVIIRVNASLPLSSLSPSLPAGGMMSVFLMGVYDSSCDQFRTVCKCGNGHDDATIQRLQTELDMVKISKDRHKVPSWLLVHRSQLPDLVVADPKVWPSYSTCRDAYLYTLSSITRQ